MTWRHDLYASTLGVRAAASHFSATALAALDGQSDPPEIPQILTPHSAPVRMPTALVRRTRWLPKADVTMIDGIPCTTMARTACDIAGLVDHDAIVRVVDDIQRRGASMLWMIQRAELLQRTGRSGPAEVLDVVRRRLGGTESLIRGSSVLSSNASSRPC